MNAQLRLHEFCRGARILLAEDKRYTADALRQTLKEAGATITGPGALWDRLSQQNMRRIEK